jgi:hypothetical protein
MYLTHLSYLLHLPARMDRLSGVTDEIYHLFPLIKKTGTIIVPAKLLPLRIQVF